MRGCRWGEQTRFTVLDIDAGSEYHNPGALSQIKAALAAGGLERSRLYRSSLSGGWHLYIFFDAWVSSERARRLIKCLLQLSGFSFCGGTLEIFPSGSGLRLPLQKGFAWLDSSLDVEVAREELSKQSALALFMADVTAFANRSEALDRLEQDLKYRLDSQSGEVDLSHMTALTGQEFDDAREVCSAVRTNKLTSPTVDSGDEMHQFEQMVLDAGTKLDEDRFRRGKYFWMYGLTENYQRHDAILCVGYYLWYGDTAAGVPSFAGYKQAPARKRLIKQWLQQKHNGYCNNINSGNWEKVEADINRATHWRRRETIEERVPYLITERLVERMVQTKLTVDIFQVANEKRETDARQKIEWAVDLLMHKGEKVTIRAIHRLTSCSRNTIKKHADIWLQCGSSDLSPVVADLGFDSLILLADEGVPTEGSAPVFVEGINSTPSVYSPAIEQQVKPVQLKLRGGQQQTARVIDLEQVRGNYVRRIYTTRSDPPNSS